MPSRVIGSTSPAASPTRNQRGPDGFSGWKSVAESEGIGHEYDSSRPPFAIPVRAIQFDTAVRSQPDVAPASACAQMPIAKWLGRGKDQMYPGGLLMNSIAMFSLVTPWAK